MTPDDWREGMENEAASIEDGVWAGEARRAARFQERGQILRLLGTVTLGYVVVGGLLAVGMNAASIGYGPQALRTLLFGFHIFPDINLTPSFLLPVVLIALLVRAGISARWVWLVPVGGTVMGALIGKFVTINAPPNLPDAQSTIQVDLLPSGLSSLTEIVLSLGINLLAILLGISLGLLLRRRQQRTLA